jgi:hypothetical protein
MTVSLINDNCEELKVDATFNVVNADGSVVQSIRRNNMHLAPNNLHALTMSDATYKKPGGNGVFNTSSLAVSSEVVRISILIHSVDGSIVHSARHSPPFLEGDFRSVNEVLPADVSIFTASQADPADRIPAHKFLLALHSPVFRAMFTSKMKEASANTIEISDFPEAVVREFVRFLYEACCTKSILDQHADQLLIMANKYQVPALMDVCERYLPRNLHVRNACQLLLLADSHGARVLRAKCLSFLRVHADTMVESGAFTDLSAELVKDVFKEFAVGMKRKAPAVNCWLTVQLLRQRQRSSDLS